MVVWLYTFYLIFSFCIVVTIKLAWLPPMASACFHCSQKWPRFGIEAVFFNMDFHYIDETASRPYIYIMGIHILVRLICILAESLGRLTHNLLSLNSYQTEIAFYILPPHCLLNSLYRERECYFIKYKYHQNHNYFERNVWTQFARIYFVSLQCPNGRCPLVTHFNKGNRILTTVI